MNQTEFNQVICELAFQLQEKSKSEVKCNHKQFIEALNAGKGYQPLHVQLMINNVIHEMNM
jgi:hypothetical protein